MIFLKEGKTNWKFIIIVLVLAVLVGGGVLLLVKIQEFSLIEFPGLKKPEKPPQDGTVDWKTYKNDKYNFSFKYPQPVLLNSYDEVGGEVEITNDAATVAAQYNSKKGVIFSVWHSGLSVLTSDSIKSQFGATSKENISMVPARIAGADGYRIIFKDTKNIVSDFYFIKKDEQILELTVLKGDTNANNILSTFKFIEKEETAKCSSIDIPDYEVYANLKVDLNGDRKKEEIVRVYRELTNTGTRALQIMVKIFSGPEECQKEEFSYKSVKENEVYLAEVMPNFWGDGKNVVMVQGVSTGYGSGSTVTLRFFTYQNGEYAIINGPQFGGHNWQCCKFDDNIPGQEIIGAESRWAEDYSDYCAGCPSRFQFYIYTWDGKEYIKTEAGITENRYSGNIDEILQEEPSVLEELE